MKFLLVFILLLNSIFADDISNFDISDIRLKMSKNEVLKKLSCAEVKITNNGFQNNINENKIYQYEISCSQKLVLVILNHKEEVFIVRKRIDFKTNLILDAIEDEINNKYGKPDSSQLIRKNEKEYVYANDTKSKTLKVHFDYKKRRVNFLLLDLKMQKESEKYIKWFKKQKKIKITI